MQYQIMQCKAKQSIQFAEQTGATDIVCIFGRKAIDIFARSVCLCVSLFYLYVSVLLCSFVCLFSWLCVCALL